jgi:RNA polymerase sigma-70 factor, ECF subfamily
VSFLARLFERTQPLANAEAFASFYESTHLNVYRYLMALRGGAQDEAEDITAEAYLRAWKNRHQFDGSAEAAFGWILTIARRILIDRYRLAARAPETGLVDDLPDATLDAESLLVDAEQMEQVLTALHELPEHQREMIVLRYVLSWRVNQIAEHLEIPENTVSVNLRRAVKQVYDLLISQGDSYE